MFLALCFLSESLTMLDMGLMTLILMSTGLCILGGPGGMSAFTFSFPLFLLILSPFMTAMGSITMRQMRKFPETCITSYVNIMLTIFMAAGMILLGESFMEYPLMFNAFDWLCMASLGGLTIVSQVFKFKAF